MLDKTVLYVLVFGEQVDATGAQIPVAYRYGLALDETVSAFQPKELEEGIDRQVSVPHNLVQFLRPATTSCQHQLIQRFFGRCGIKRMFLNGSTCESTNFIKQHDWPPHQVAVGEEAPALVRPLKPKYYLMGSVCLKKHTSVNLA